jgi:hypothetical protein
MAELPAVFRKVRRTKQYTSVSGNVFWSYESDDGLSCGIRVRTGRDGLYEYTTAEARAEAIRRMGAMRSCGRRLAGRYCVCGSGEPCGERP